MSWWEIFFYYQLSIITCVKNTLKSWVIDTVLKSIFLSWMKIVNMSETIIPPRWNVSSRSPMGLQWTTSIHSHHRTSCNWPQKIIHRYSEIVAPVYSSNIKINWQWKRNNTAGDKKMLTWDRLFHLIMLHRKSTNTNCFHFQTFPYGTWLNLYQI